MEARASIPVGPPIANPLFSYWQEPKSPIANLIEPETEDPKTPYDYAIIGSGISGTMIAYNLLRTQPNARIIMLEAREICSGATGRNGGHTKAASYRSYSQYVQELGKQEALKIARLEYANIIETHQLASELGLDCEGKLCNTVDLIYDKPTFELGKLAIQALRADAEAHEKEEGKAAWYRIHEDISDIQTRFCVAAKNTNPMIDQEEELSGAFEYLAGRIHAYRFTTGILSTCVQKGLQLCTNTPVHAIRPTSTPPSTPTSKWQVFTQHTIIPAQTVILATNGYTPYLLPALQSAIVPMRGQITVHRPGPAAKLPSPLPTTYSFIYKNGYEYMIPRPLQEGQHHHQKKHETQHIIIGGGLGRLPNAGETEYGTVNDSALNPQISTYLRESLVHYHGPTIWGESTKPQADNETDDRIVQEWTGIMGATADGRPFVGEVPGKQGLWVSAGFNGHGMVLCLKAAGALVEMIDGKGIPKWFPESFLVGEERVAKVRFGGRVDMKA